MIEAVYYRMIRVQTMRLLVTPEIEVSFEQLELVCVFEAIPRTELLVTFRCHQLVKLTTWWILSICINDIWEWMVTFNDLAVMQFIDDVNTILCLTAFRSISRNIFRRNCTKYAQLPQMPWVDSVEVDPEINQFKETRSISKKRKNLQKTKNVNIYVSTFMRCRLYGMYI